MAKTIIEYAGGKYRIEKARSYINACKECDLCDIIKCGRPCAEFDDDETETYYILKSIKQ